MTSKPVLYGYDASAYPRIARLMLVEKGVDHDYMRVANWSGYEKLPGFEDLHPFAKVPVFEHGGFRLYETGAILRYVDEAFQGPALQPASCSRPPPRRSCASPQTPSISAPASP